MWIIYLFVLKSDIFVSVFLHNILWICFMCVLLCLNRLPHFIHWNGRSSLWILLCSFIFENWLNLFPHVSHSNGFSPVCVYKCLFKWLDFKKGLLQTLQLYSPVCIFSWYSFVLRVVKFLSQYRHLNGRDLSLEWMISCLIIWFFCLKHFPQKLHL